MTIVVCLYPVKSSIYKTCGPSRRRTWIFLDIFLVKDVVPQGVAVDEKPIIVHCYDIPWDTHDTFYQTRAISGRIKHEDVSPFGTVPTGDMRRGVRHFQIIGQFIGKNPVSLENGRFHRSRRDNVPIRYGRFERCCYKQCDEDTSNPSPYKYRQVSAKMFFIGYSVHYHQEIGGIPDFRSIRWIDWPNYLRIRQKRCLSHPLLCHSR